MKNLILVSLLLSGFQAFADGAWRTQNLQSTTGQQISLDFQMRCQNFPRAGHNIQQRLADPMWINIRGIQGNPRVTVDVEFYTISYIHSGSNPQLYRAYNYYDRSLVLEPTKDGRFTVNANSMVIREDDSAGNSGLDVVQKIALQSKRGKPD